MDPEDQKHQKEVCEANHIEDEVIVAMRWAKPIKRRSPGQKTAHLIISFVDAQAANRAIANGLMICNRRTHLEKIKKEPIRCLKCQGWNHFAYECILNVDKCGNCAKEHRTSLCPNPRQKYCISCDTDEHASWSRECPVFLRKVSECDRRNPENALQFIPTAEPWTWSTKPETREAERAGRAVSSLHNHSYREPRYPQQNRTYEPEAIASWDDPTSLSWEQVEWGVHCQLEAHSLPPPTHRQTRETQKLPSPNPALGNAT